jgi:hypothetical protein
MSPIWTITFQGGSNYLRIAAIARVVQRDDRIGMALRRGRQYARSVKFLSSYEPPRQGEMVAWSRILFDQEVVVALNTLF